jgi:hypothetical protein
VGNSLGVSGFGFVQRIEHPAVHMARNIDPRQKCRGVMNRRPRGPRRCTTQTGEIRVQTANEHYRHMSKNVIVADGDVELQGT